MAERAYVVEVNEAAVWATRQGVDWWTLWRARMERTGRIDVTVVSIAGDRVRAACDSRDDADWLAGHMVSFGGLPQRAVKVRAA